MIIMGQTFEPDHRYAKAFGVNMKISAKNSTILCRVVRNKTLNKARRLLEDLDAGKRSLEGKYYSNAARDMLALLNSCVKNAEFKGLDTGRLFVHASATHGTNIQRRRRKGAFGSQMKTTNMEILLIERGKEAKSKRKAAVKGERKEVRTEHKEHKEKTEHEAHEHKEGERAHHEKKTEKAVE